MSKFNILDDCMFSASYLLHSKFALNEIVGLDFNSHLVFVVINSAQSKML